MARSITQSDMYVLPRREAVQINTADDRRSTLNAVKKQNSKQKLDPPSE